MTATPRPGYEAWQRAHGRARDSTDGLTVDPAHPPAFIDPAAYDAYQRNAAAEKEMLAALYNFRYLIYQDGQESDEQAKAAGALLLTRLREMHDSARTLVHRVRPAITRRPRSADE